MVCVNWVIVHGHSCTTWYRSAYVIFGCFCFIGSVQEEDRMFELLRLD